MISRCKYGILLIMSKNSLWKLFVIIFVNLGLVLLLNINIKRSSGVESSKIGIGSSVLDIEVVSTEKERETGLMYRDNLPQGHGMLFVFDSSGFYPFWMKNTSIPLDIVWINTRGRIIDIRKNVRPCIEFDKTQKNCPYYTPAEKAKYVLEVNSGWVEKNGISLGTFVDFLSQSSK